MAFWASTWAAAGIDFYRASERTGRQPDHTQGLRDAGIC